MSEKNRKCAILGIPDYLSEKSSKIWTWVSGKIYAPSYREYLVQFGISPGLSPLSHYAERHPPLELTPVR
jgi:hypothetical protein